MFQGAVDAVQKATRNGKSFSLPASSELLAASALDKIEKSVKADVALMFGHARKQRQKRKLIKGQGNWGSLEESLIADARKSTESQGTKLSLPANDWHEIPEVKMTPELEKDLKIVENRGHLDPKRFYKSSGSGRKKGELPKRVHVGTVVAGAHEFYSARLTRKERRKSILDEVLSDSRIVRYTKNKLKALRQEKAIKKRTIDPAARRKRK